MTSGFSRIFGPRVPREELETQRGRYLLPTLLFTAAALILLVSVFTPYWRMTLLAPQYPGGLHVQAFLNRLTGDVAEIDGLNHYIGMRPLGEAAQLERSLSFMAIAVQALLVVGAILIHNRWAALLAAPAVLFPAAFLVDLQLWMRHFGQNLDPRAPLSSAIKPFTPPVLGVGKVGQFKTVAGPDVGLVLAMIASVVVIVGLWAHRRAYKPLVDRQKDRDRTGSRHAAAALVFALLGPGLAGTSEAASGPDFDLRSALSAAAPGAVVEVPAGVHAGPFLVEKPVQIAGRPGAVLEGPGKGDVVRVTAPGVTLRGLVIRGTGKSLDQENAGVTVLADRTVIEDNVLEDVLFGIYLKEAADCVIRRNRISGKDLDVQRRGDLVRLWRSDRCVIEDNEMTDGRDVVIWFSTDVRIARNRVVRGRYGLHFMYSDSNIIEDNHLEGNSVGGFLMYSRNLRLVRNVFLANRGPSGYGIGLKDMDGVFAEDNRFLGNRIGIYLDNSPWSVDVYDEFRRNVLAYNDIGVAFQPAVKRNVFRDNTFLENLEQVAVLGAGDFHGNDFTVDGRGNFWSDYSGYDLDGDGLGDLAYRSESLFENLIDRETKLRLFLYSPVQQAIEMAARALPSIKPRPKLEDTAPLMSPVPLQASPLAVPPRWPLGLLAAGLVGGAILVVRTSRPNESAGAVVRRPPPAAPEAAPVMQIRSLTKRFGKFTAVDDLSFEVARGEALALWGRNGAGKTTAIKCALGLLDCRGEIRVAGNELKRDGKAVRRSIGYVPQELALYADMGALESLVFYARLKKVPASRARDVLEEVGLKDGAKKKVSELSGGMKQRLALAAALLAEPEILILDEMTSNLDASARIGLLGLLVRLKRRGKSILFTSHRLDEIHALADRVLVLEEGRVASECAPYELAGTLGLEARLDLRVDDRAATVEVLRGLGYEPSTNGGELVRVRMPRDCKIEVLLRLEEAGVRVRDFEVDGEVLAAENEPEHGL